MHNPFAAMMADMGGLRQEEEDGAPAGVRYHDGRIPADRVDEFVQLQDADDSLRRTLDMERFFADVFNLDLEETPLRGHNVTVMSPTRIYARLVLWEGAGAHARHERLCAIGKPSSVPFAFESMDEFDRQVIAGTQSRQAERARERTEEAASETNAEVRRDTLASIEAEDASAPAALAHDVEESATVDA